MKRIFGSIAVSLALSLAVAGCVPLETERPPASQDPAAQATEAQKPAPVVAPPEIAPTVEPYSAKGLKKRIANLSEGAVSREIRDGQHPIDLAVPGTERTVLAGEASGAFVAALPEKLEGDSILIAIQCLTGSGGEGPIRASFSGPDLSDESGSGMMPNCDSGSGFWSSSGINTESPPALLNISVPAGTRYEYSVVTFALSPDAYGNG